MNRLITIPISHYCEKARWALEWTGIPYVEKKHLQGFHYFYSYWAGKSESVPVLVTPDNVLSDSSDILHWCDSQAPADRKLLSADSEKRAETLALEEFFDEGLGVEGRLWMYTYMLHEIPLILKYSIEHGVPEYEVALMPILFPFIKGHIHRVLNLTHTSQEHTKSLIDEVFAKVAKQLEGKKFLVGDSFSAADLTFAALSAAVLIPENYGVSLPRLEELPEQMRRQVEVWRAHPAGQYALRIYKEFRTKR